MSLEYSFLADRIDAIPLVTRWYVDQWGYREPGNRLENEIERLKEYANRDRIPFILLATHGEEIVAAAQLKFREMAEMFPHKEHWLGGVYVAAEHRGRGYASQLVRKVAELAPTYGVRTLHLQTEALDGGLYARLGWMPFTQVNSNGQEVLVMERQL